MRSPVPSLDARYRSLYGRPIKVWIIYTPHAVRERIFGGVFPARGFNRAKSALWHRENRRFYFNPLWIGRTFEQACCYIFVQIQCTVSLILMCLIWIETVLLNYIINSKSDSECSLQIPIFISNFIVATNSTLTEIVNHCKNVIVFQMCRVCAFDTFTFYVRVLHFFILEIYL